MSIRMRIELYRYHMQTHTEINPTIQKKLTNVALLYLNRYKQHCYKYCPQNTYRDESSLQCRECPSNCDSCDMDKCNSCKEGFYLSGKPSTKYGIYTKVFEAFSLKKNSGANFSNS